jgi:hypothetical protein
MRRQVPMSIMTAEDGELYKHIKKRLSELQNITYEDCSYIDTWDLCNAIGVDRSVFIWLYLQSNMPLDVVVKLAQEIEGA